LAYTCTRNKPIHRPKAIMLVFEAVLPCMFQLITTQLPFLPGVMIVLGEKCPHRGHICSSTKYYACELSKNYQARKIGADNMQPYFIFLFSTTETRMIRFLTRYVLQVLNLRAPLLTLRFCHTYNRSSDTLTKYAPHLSTPPLQSRKHPTHLVPQSI
jgi:hypothetical protein